MSMTIAQDFEYQGDDWWKWWVWIDAAENELDEIDHVIYILHHTFPNPVRTIKDRHSKFRLDTSGWGVFRIHAKVVDKEGNQTALKHDLVLRYPDGRETAA